MLIDKIKQRAAELDNYVKETRGYLHTIPEIAGSEFKTKEFILGEIKKTAADTNTELQIEEVPTTGLIVILDTGRAGKTIALRADIDGLPFKESENNHVTKKKYCSTNGNTHGCGHDAHVAMLLTSMKIICEMKDELKGRVIFVFEEGEENFTGIYPMIAALRKYTIDGFWGIHVFTTLENGKLVFTEGPMLAGGKIIDFTVVGRGGHGSRPDLSINPVFAAASIITNLGVAWPNNMHPDVPVTLGIATINGGSAVNVFPDEVRVTGTFRFFDEKAGKKALEVFERVVTNTAKAHNCTVRFNTDWEITMIPTVNDPEMTRFAKAASAEILGDDGVMEGLKSYGSESFSHYSKLAPAAFGILAVGNKEKGTYGEHHTVEFDVDEDELIKGSMATCAIVSKFLN